MLASLLGGGPLAGVGGTAEGSAAASQLLSRSLNDQMCHPTAAEKPMFIHQRIQSRRQCIPLAEQACTCLPHLVPQFLDRSTRIINLTGVEPAGGQSLTLAIKSNDPLLLIKTAQWVARNRCVLRCPWQGEQPAIASGASGAPQWSS